MRTTIARCGNIKNIYFIVLCVILLQMVGCTQASISDENLPSENIVITNNDVVMPENLNKSDNIFEQIEGSWEIVDFAGTINNFHSEIEETPEYNEQIEKLISEKSENTIGKIIKITDETVYGYYPLSEMGYLVDDESSLMCVTHFLPNGDETVFPYLTLRVKLIDGEEYIFLIDSNNEAFCGIDNYYWEVKNISADITYSFANINNDEQNDRNGVDNHKIIYSNFILGDRDVLERTQQEKWFIPDFQNDGHNYEYMFLDLVLCQDLEQIKMGDFSY